MNTEPYRTPITLTRIGAWMLIVLGAVHLILLAVLKGDVIAGWFVRGLWAAVPLGAPQTEESLVGLVAFWGGYGSFGMPFILLGVLLLSAASRAVPPLAIGVVLTLWGAVGAVLLVPSPMILVVATGIVLIAASVRGRAVGQRERQRSALSSR